MKYILENKKIIEKTVLTVIFLIAVLLIASIDNYFKNKSVVNNQATTTPIIIDSGNLEYPDYIFYQKMRKLELVSNLDSGGVVSDGDKLKPNGKIYKKFIKSDGDVVNAYLYVDTSVDNEQPLKVWDSIYVSLRKEENGYLRPPLEGHLLRSKSLKTISTSTTKLLYDLGRIPFTKIPYSDDNQYISKDWLSLIKGGNKFQFESFLSTMRKGGKINNISIGYECSEATPNCRLEVVDK